MSWNDLQSVICDEARMSLLSIQSWDEMDLIGRHIFWWKRGFHFYENTLNPEGIRVLIGNYLTQRSQMKRIWTSPVLKSSRLKPKPIQTILINPITMECFNS